MGPDLRNSLRSDLGESRARPECCGILCDRQTDACPYLLDANEDRSTGTERVERPQDGRRSLDLKIVCVVY